jgi:hypothetical protein
MEPISQGMGYEESGKGQWAMGNGFEKGFEALLDLSPIAYCL